MPVVSLISKPFNTPGSSVTKVIHSLFGFVTSVIATDALSGDAFEASVGATNVTSLSDALILTSRDRLP